MMKILTKKHIEQINWPELTELIVIAGLNRRGIGKIEQAFLHSTFCWFGYENGKLIAAARAISDMTFSSYLSDVVINPISHGKGYSQQLMQTIAQDLKPFGKIFIYAVPDKIWILSTSWLRNTSHCNVI